MIRFIPDTLREWLLRPIAMAAPDGWVYTEICAPDFRFAILLLLLAAVLAFRIRRDGVRLGRPLLAAIFLCAISFVPWLATTGNGRYFMPYLLLVGPLCIALAVRLPVTAAMRSFVVVMVVAAQGFALAQNSPWKPFDSWEWIPWREAPYFSIDTAPVANDKDVTYVGISLMTLSLIAPQFPPEVRWVNLSTFDGADVGKGRIRHYERMNELLDGGRLRLLHRTQPRAIEEEVMQPNVRAVTEIDAALAPHRLALRKPTDCVLLRSRSLSKLTMTMEGDSPQRKAQLEDRAGFWACTLVRVPDAPVPREPTPAELHAKAVFEKVETLCPRFFPAGQETVRTTGTVHVRIYHASDSILMLASDDELYIKYERALNPQRLALGKEVLQPGFRLDCNAFRGRSGLPWERAI
ncbi:hypothetical protein [Ramlibacter sp.]|uniref:hypothetical protein n=1 Tax=Ramlibacter sp. TaxID=1917967 RepID=UPI003D1355FA